MKKIEIIEPSEEIFKISNEIQEKIKKILPTSRTRLIGSFSIPLPGKKEIDILIEVEDLKEAKNKLIEEGFSLNNLEIKNEIFLHYKIENVVCDIHLLKFNDKKIKEVYDKVTNYFRENEKERKDFANFKRSLEGISPEEYKKRKSEFLEKTVFAEWMKKKRKRNITITGPRSIGKTTISKQIARKLEKEYISADELGDKAMKKIGGLDKAIKSGKIKEFINSKGYTIILDIYNKKKNFIFDLSIGSFSSKKFKKASDEVRSITKKNSIIVGILPSRCLIYSVITLFKREIKREHFKGTNKSLLFWKTLKRYPRTRRILKKNSDILIYTRGKNVEEIVKEIIYKFKRID